MAIIKLSLVGLATIILTIGVYHFDSRCEAFRKLPYMQRQLIIGCIFGALAIFGTECGVPYEGAMLNIRDAAPVCASLIFGGPAGIIAGLIGGIERWFAVYWGVGMYTRVACTVGTIFAGLFSAFVRVFLMEDRRSKWIYSVGVAIVCEVFHMLMVFLTHMDDYVYALTVVRHCSLVMIPAVAITAAFATVAVNVMAHETELLRQRKHGIAQKIGSSLFFTVLIASIIMIGFVVIYQDRIACQQAKATISNTIDDVVADIEYSEKHSDNPEEAITTATRNRRIGTNGIIIIATKNFTPVASSASEDETAKYNISSEKFKEHSVRIRELDGGEIYSWTDGDDVDFYCMCKPIKDYYILGFYPKEEADIIKWSSIYLTAFALVIILAAIFVQIYFLIRTTILKNIKEINSKLAKITDGNLDTVVEAGGSDEFVSLSDDINTTVATLKHYIEEAKSRIDKELELAKNIQYSALNKDFPDDDRYELYANMLAAREVGGDFYDFYKIDEDRIAFLIADVSGKGIPAAMFMMKSKTLIKSLIDSGADVATVLTKANEELCQNNQAEMFVTGWIGILDLNTNIVTFANAGHNKPIVVRDNGNAEYLSCRSGFILAGMEGIKYKAEEIQLEKGDSIYLYTDGVTEAVNKNNELYGDDRLLAEIDETQDMKPAHMCKYIKKSIDNFAGESPQFDDITMLAIRIKDEDDRDREKVVVPNRDSLEEVENYFEHRCEQLELSMKMIAKINIVIDEIFSNIIYYSGASSAKLSLTDNNENINIIFNDNGIEYNPLDKEDPDINLSAEERNIGGLGIFMVKKMSEEMIYERIDGRNITSVTLKKE